LAEDPKWELAILATVQSFGEKLLQEYVEGEVPVPQGLEDVSLAQSDIEVHATLGRMRRWLRLLDMATTPAMLRRALTEDTDPEIAEAMLRYLVRRKDGSEASRDKTDIVVTFLYRHPRVPGQWEKRGYGLDGSLPLSPFEIALIEILADTDVPELPEEHVQLLRRFGPLQEEAEKFHDFHALVDSGIVTRVRELKRQLESSFSHPGVLATVAPYNAAFGKKFDSLFHLAVADLKEYANSLQEQGGSILGNVDGVDVTVEHIVALEEGALLKLDYRTALEKFQNISKLRRALEKHPPMRGMLVGSTTGRSGAAAAPARERRPSFDLPAARAGVTPQQVAAEEAMLQKVEESIRMFVRVADPMCRQIVPMRFFNLTLTPAEADAYCANYLQEKTLRSGVARALVRIVAMIGRITTEMEELRRHENSTSLWKIHADSLVTLLELTQKATDDTKRLMEVAQRNGAPQQVEALHISLEKLHDREQLTVSRLSQNN
jgi:hypothetical protein